MEIGNYNKRKRIEISGGYEKDAQCCDILIVPRTKPLIEDT